jgi:surface antigen
MAKTKHSLALSCASIMFLTGCTITTGFSNIAGGGQKQHASAQKNAAANCIKKAGTSGGTGNLGDQNHLTGTSDKLSGDQNKVAQTIVSVGQNRGLPEKAHAIAVATGLVESGLTNINYGDDMHGVTNPDGTPTSSLGVFQQQKWWGTEEERMNVSRSAEIFYEHLEAIDWESMSEGAAAQRVQGSAYPGKYSQRMSEAYDIVRAVSSSSNNTEKHDNKKEDSKKDGGSVSARKANCNTANHGTAQHVDTKGEDTYPVKFTPTDAEKSAFFRDEVDPWGSYKGQCVSYILWKLNEAHGATLDKPINKASFGMGGDANARNWDNIDRNFATVDKNPTPGSIAQFEPGAMDGIGEYGHVAWVEEVDEAQGRVRISQYNWVPLQYNEIWINKDSVSNYIHVK